MLDVCIRKWFVCRFYGFGGVGVCDVVGECLVVGGSVEIYLVGCVVISGVVFV